MSNKPPRWAWKKARRLLKDNDDCAALANQLKRLLHTVCWYCGLKVKGYSDVSIDHCTPVSRGGAHNVANLRAMHRFCNVAKGALTKIEFDMLMASLNLMQPEVKLSILRRLVTGWRTGFIKNV